MYIFTFKLKGNEFLQKLQKEQKIAERLKKKLQFWQFTFEFTLAFLVIRVLKSVDRSAGLGRAKLIPAILTTQEHY